MIGDLQTAMRGFDRIACPNQLSSHGKIGDRSLVGAFCRFQLLKDVCCFGGELRRHDRLQLSGERIVA